MSIVAIAACGKTTDQNERTSSTPPTRSPSSSSSRDPAIESTATSTFDAGGLSSNERCQVEEDRYPVFQPKRTELRSFRDVYKLLAKEIEGAGPTPKTEADAQARLCADADAAALEPCDRAAANLQSVRTPSCTGTGWWTVGLRSRTSPDDAIYGVVERLATDRFVVLSPIGMDRPFACNPMRNLVRVVPATRPHVVVIECMGRRDATPACATRMENDPSVHCPLECARPGFLRTDILLSADGNVSDRFLVRGPHLELETVRDTTVHDDGDALVFRGPENCLSRMKITPLP